LYSHVVECGDVGVALGHAGDGGYLVPDRHLHRAHLDGTRVPPPRHAHDPDAGVPDLVAVLPSVNFSANGQTVLLAFGPGIVVQGQATAGGRNRERLSVILVVLAGGRGRVRCWRSAPDPRLAARPPWREQTACIARPPSRLRCPGASHSWRGIGSYIVRETYI
jgi:hypothetical protein